MLRRAASRIRSAWRSGRAGPGSRCTACASPRCAAPHSLTGLRLVCSRACKAAAEPGRAAQAAAIPRVHVPGCMWVGNSMDVEIYQAWLKLATAIYLEA